MPRTVRWSNRIWQVRDTGRGGPGPNVWSPDQVKIDRRGQLVLTISPTEQEWRCGELNTTERLGFGTYTFEVVGPIGRLDPAIVVGLFTYPTRDVGGNATHEIDIEFARWGNARYPSGNYTIWPAEEGVKSTSHTFELPRELERSFHRFVWSAKQIVCESAHDRQFKRPFQSWTFAPDDPERRISQKPQPVHLNLWLFGGKPPADGKPVTIVLPRFDFVPETP